MRLIPLFALFFTSTLVAADRPNVIVFISDDISWNDHGCYGNEAARTPNIDALAANGIRFDRAYLTASSCSPSRSSIITGRYPHNNGRASELHLPIAGHLPWFPAKLREVGYYTVLSGKDHMTRDGAEIDAWDQKSAGRVKGVNSGGHANWVNELAAVPAGKPFFAWFAANDAHRAWDADKEWNEDLYGPRHRPEDVLVPPFLVDDEGTREDLASYYNEVTRFDHFIGDTVAALKKSGKFENTLIFVLSDNGRPFPRAKTRLHDSGMKTALVAHWPAGIQHPGEPTDKLASVIDLAPTILGVAGMKTIPETMQGVDLSPIFADRGATVRRYAFSEHNWHDYEAHARSVRDTEGWLYIENNRVDKAWQGPADSVRSPSFESLKVQRDAGKLSEAQADVFMSPRAEKELYFVPEDPHQLKNLAGDPDHADVQKALAAVLAEWTEATGDSAPANLSADSFDRETGASLLKKGDRDSFRGVPAGSDRGADRINDSGPQ